MLKIVFLSMLLVGSLLAETETKIIPAEQPNGCLLIFAHGYRPEGFPNPAIVDDEGLAYKTLHDQGWTLAATSYRKTGMVVEEGADDIDQLRDEIERKYGPIKRCILHGESMGGTIVTMLAERDPKRYQGAVAVGAAMDILPSGKTWVGPKIPLLFLTNESEMEGPQKYVDQFRADAKNLVLWKVFRDGHCNVNQSEVLAALLAINQAVDGASLVSQNGTFVLNPNSIARPSKKLFSVDVEVNVKEIDPVFGNFVADVTPSELASNSSIKRGDYFTIQYRAETRKVLFGKEFSDVPEGAWVAFENADGLLRIAMNFRNAAVNLGIKKGDKIIIQQSK